VERRFSVHGGLGGKVGGADDFTPAVFCEDLWESAQFVIAHHSHEKLPVKTGPPAFTGLCKRIAPFYLC
jgi:hypothetical protein